MRSVVKVAFCHSERGRRPSDAGVGNWSSSDKSRDARARSRRPGSGAVSDGPPRQRSGAPPSHLQPVDQGPAFRLARKGLPHGRSRQSSEGPQRSAGPAQRVDGRDRPYVVNALRAQRGPYPVAPPTGPNPPTPLSGEPQFCPQILRKTQPEQQEGRSRQMVEGQQGRSFAPPAACSVCWLDAVVRADFTGPLSSRPATTCLKVRKTGRLDARERA